MEGSFYGIWFGEMGVLNDNKRNDVECEESNLLYVEIRLEEYDEKVYDYENSVLIYVELYFLVVLIVES